MVPRALPLRVAAVTKLSPERERDLLNEMELAELLTEKAWQRRYGISPRTIRRLRARVRERRRETGLRPDVDLALCFATPSTAGARKA